MNRDLCVYDNSKVSTIKSIKDFPIYCGQSEEEGYETFDLDFGISDNGTIQLTKLVPLDKLYKHTHNDAIGNVWYNHFKKLSEFIKPHISNKTIFEFGGGSCKTFFFVEELVKKWITLDFNPTNKPNNKLHSIVGDVDNNFDNTCDVYFSSHFLEHLYHPYKFLSNLSSCKIGTKHIFSIPKQSSWMQRGYANALFFEHSVVLENDKLIEEHKKYGYVLVDFFDYDEHSVFYCFEKVSVELEYEQIDTYSQNLKLLKDYIGMLKGVYDIDEHFYIFSAHIQSQYILKLNDYSDLCLGVLDNSPLKVGKKLYGFGLNIFSPKDSNKNIPILVPNSSYSKEIKEQLISLGYRNVI